MAENNTNAPLIETSAVGFTYQGSETPALQDVTLSIGAGECVLLCVLGHLNGSSGKGGRSTAEHHGQRQQQNSKTFHFTSSPLSAF